MILNRKLRLTSFISTLYQPVGYLLLCFLALAISAAIIQWGITAFAAISLLLIGVPFVFSIIRYPQFGILTLLVSAYLVMWVNRMLLVFPTGTLMDGLEVLLIIGFFIKHKYDKSWEFAKSPISFMIIVWVLFNVLEVLNPDAQSKLAWVYTIRTIGIVTLTYFLFMYHIRSVAFIRLIIKTWLLLSAFAAIYTIAQEYHGFFAFEEKWLATASSNAGLYFIAGRWRRFSIFSEPVAAAYNMVISSLLAISLLFITKSVVKKIALTFLIIIFITAMLYTGIRGSFVLLPAGIAFMFLLKLNKRVMVVGAICAVIFAVLIKMPTHNTVLYRFQTAFYPSYDPSFNVRKNNQKRIQPYIQSHPIGGGLGATGTWGQRFSPNSYLASFPPDSGFVRVAVEEGWIGLLLICAVLFVFLQQGITNYFLIRDAELKHYCLAMVLIVFVLSIGNYPQEALVQFPINIYFYLVVALINITLKLDRELLKK
jgi:hypothetical protein